MDSESMSKVLSLFIIPELPSQTMRYLVSQELSVISLNVCDVPQFAPEPAAPPAWLNGLGAGPSKLT